MMKKRLTSLTFLVFFGLISAVSAAPACDEGYYCTHGLAMHDEPPLYPADSKQLNWANPDAPKGGMVKMVGNGTFDNLNPFILKGIAAAGIDKLYDTLGGHSNDEPFTVYGLIAERIDLAKDNSHVIFRLNPKARFHDGESILADDVVFSFEKLTTEGLPYYRAYWGDVEKVTAPDDHSVRFDFKVTTNKELPLILGQLPVLPKHRFVEGGGDRVFGETTLEIPVGSGPYKVASLDPGKWIRYERVEDYWAKDHFLNKGLYNFDVIHYDYYRDMTVAMEAFKAGELDVRAENISKNWATAYDFDAVKNGDVIKIERPNHNPTGMQAFVLNLRKKKFGDIRVREALDLAFDFQWTNENIFYDAYFRTESFFSNSEFASTGKPSEAELQLLVPLRDQIPPAVFEGPYVAPTTDGDTSLRDNLKRAAELFKEAGYVVQDGVLVHDISGDKLTIEFLLSSVTYERLVAPYVKNLKRIGVDALIRTVDPAQYIGRLEQHDFDVIIHTYPQSLSPGNEQVEYWHSSKAHVPGARNLSGISDPAVDALVQAILEAGSRDALVTACRALDRVLLHNHYVVPQYHVRNYRYAHWNRFGMPEVEPNFAFGFESWWIDDAKAEKLESKLGR